MEQMAAQNRKEREGIPPRRESMAGDSHGRMLRARNTFGLLFASSLNPSAGDSAEISGKLRQKTGAYIALPSGRQIAVSVRTPMLRQQIVVDPALGWSLFVSVSLHVFPLFLLWLLSSTIKYGAPQGKEDTPQVEMVFMPPAASHAQSHPQESGGAAQAPPPPPEQKAPPTPEVPTPHSPSDAASPAIDGELVQVPAPSRNVSPARPRAEHHDRQEKQTQKQVRPSRETAQNPFAHPMDWSFNGPPAPKARHRGRNGGQHGPVDFSLGPLSMNGQINAPYRAKSMVKGVSSDYGAEIDRWVRAHMYYPEDAASNGEEGPSSVHVVLDRSGHVRSVRLTGQSGSYSLDAATAGMFQGAKLPPVPPDMSGDHFDMDVTINYILIRH